jgi:GT2 family glycosyltransferase
LTVEALLHTCPDDTEIIVVNDDSTDGSLDFLAEGEWPRVQRLDLARRGISETRNEGARLASGEIVLFLDAHCVPRRDWLPPLVEALAADPEGIVAPCITVLGHCATKGYGADITGPDLCYAWHTAPESPEAHPVPVAGGCGLAMRRDYFFRIGAFDLMRTYGLEDVEICLRAWLLGGSVRVVPESEIAHLFKVSAQYEVPWRDYLYNRLRVAVLHFEGTRLDRVLTHFAQSPACEEARRLLDSSDALQLRDRYRSLRVRDADWFCERFGVVI